MLKCSSLSLSLCTVGGSLGMLYHWPRNLEIQFATVQTVNFFANFINAAKKKMLG